MTGGAGPSATVAPRPLRSTPLLAEHERLGAVLTDFAGWRMPLRYGSELAEHHAVRGAAGLFDLSHMGEIEIVGPEAGPALDHALTGRLSTLAVGRAKYSLLCAPDGGVLDDLVVYRTAEDRFLVVANAANTAVVLDALAERAAGSRAEVVDRSAETALVAVQGPRAQAVLAAAVPEAAARIDALRYYGCAAVVLAGATVLLARTGYTGEDGFELYLPAPSAAALWRVLLAAGREHGLVPAGLACRDTLRLEVGMALHGHELTAATDPYAAGLGRAVALDTDFVGRAALERPARAEPPRTLAGLAGTGRRAARRGDTVHDERGRVVGVVTSGGLSPTLGHPVALGYLDTPLARPGTELAVDVRGRRLPFTVRPLPFYRRSSTGATT